MGLLVTQVEKLYLAQFLRKARFRWNRAEFYICFTFRIFFSVVSSVTRMFSTWCLSKHWKKIIQFFGAANNNSQ